MACRPAARGSRLLPYSPLCERVVAGCSQRKLPWSAGNTDRHMGLRSEFDQAAKNLHDHFNVRTLTWDDAIADVPLRGLVATEEERVQDAAAGGLEQIPHICARIQAAWGSVECRDYLRQLLLDNRGGERLGFPYSVLTDILLLEDVLTELLARKD